MSEKAEELYRKFYKILFNKVASKQCALICVDEMHDFAITKGVYEPQDVVDYITKLKQEINNL